MKKRLFKKQEGITLLIAVLIVSATAVVTSTVGYFAIQEIRASRAVSMSEPAISAALSGGEEGLWSIKRGGTLTACPNATTTSVNNNVKIDLCKSYGPAEVTVTAGVPYMLYLYNPNDINGDADLSDYPYSYVQVTNYSASTTMGVDVKRIDDTPVSTQSVTPGNTITINIPAVSPGQEGRMKITLTTPSTTNVWVNTNRGMPEYPILDSSGCSSAATITTCNDGAEIYKRKINITVPQ